MCECSPGVRENLLTIERKRDNVTFAPMVVEAEAPSLYHVHIARSGSTRSNKKLIQYIHPDDLEGPADPF